MRRLFQLCLLPLLTLVVSIPSQSYAGVPHSRWLTPFTWSGTCLNEEITFTIGAAAGIDSVQWDFGDPASGSNNISRDMQPVHMYTAASAYTITLTAYRAGVPDVTPQTITIIPKWAYTFPEPGNITLCEGQQISLQAPEIAGATYEWSRKDSLRSSIVADTSATYQVKINGCALPDSVNVFFTPIPEVELGTDHILCSGEAIRLDATSQNSTFEWRRNGVNIPGETSSTLVATTNGTYTVLVNAAGCGTYTDQTTLTFSGGPHPFSLGADTLLCPGESITLAPDVPGATRYQWSTGSGSPSVTVDDPGDIWAFIEIDRECEVLDTINIGFNALQHIDLGNDTTICKGEFLVLTADYGTGSYLWQDGSQQATFYVREPGYFYVEARIGRCQSTDTIHVLYDDTLHVNLGPDLQLCKGETVQLYPTGAGGNYKWQDSTTVPIYNVTDPGIYALVANNACGRSTDSVTAQVTDCQCRLFLPTAFSPNGDGINDYFRPHYRCLLAAFKLSIYDRWGERLFFSSDPQVAWTGRKQGIPVNTGTYVWILEYRSAETDALVQQNGTVTVVY